MKIKIARIINLSFILLLLLTSFISTRTILAQTSCEGAVNVEACEAKNAKIAAIEAQIKELEAKLSENKKKEGDIKNNINYLDGQINLSKLKIQESEAIIEKRQLDIDNLTNNILLLEDSLDKNTKLFLKRINLSYKQGNLSPFLVFFGNGSFYEKVSRYKFLQAVQSADRQFLFKIQETKNSYRNQKNLVEQEKKALEAEKIQLEDRKQVLANQIEEKENLLAETQQEEKVLSATIENLKAQRDSLFGGVSSLISSNSGCKVWTEDDNYFNQTDCRWGNVIIGNANYSNDSFMWKYGCAVTSVAMVMKKMGISTNPQSIAQNSSFFAKSGSYQTDLIMWNAVASNFGKTLNWLSNWSQIDEKLSQGKWVIVHVSIGGYGWGHYVVLTKKEGNDYKMHDPYYGNNLMFYSYYSGADQIIVYE